MKENTERLPSYVRRYVSPHAVGHGDLDLDLYRQPLEALATLQQEVADRIDHAQERLDYLASKASASNLAIQEYQDQLGALNTARSNDDAEAQRLRDVLFDLEQDQQHVVAALERAERHRQMEVDGERRRIAQLPWQEPYRVVQGEAEEQLTATLVLYVQTEGSYIGGMKWTFFIDHIIGLGPTDGTNKQGEPLNIAIRQNPELLASIAKARALVRECQRLSVLATGNDGYFPHHRYFDAARVALELSTGKSGNPNVFDNATPSQKARADGDAQALQDIIQQDQADHAALFTTTDGDTH